MKLIYSPHSPFARKVLVCAHELALRGRIELVAAAPSPVNRDQGVAAHNPLGKIPTLIDEQGAALYDSRVICEYLDSLAPTPLTPSRGPERWIALTHQSLADGIMDAALLARYESALRPEPLRWAEWMQGQLDKIAAGLAELERHAARFGDRVDIGSITAGCALGYLDHRFAPLGWRSSHPALAAWFERFAQRESLLTTRPPAA